MRRWNGWGDENVNFPLGEAGQSYLGSVLGPGTRPCDATLEETMHQVPSSRLPDHHLVRTEAVERLRHARGQSFPDWLAMRSGRVPSFPDGVAHPETEDEVRELISFCSDGEFRLVPYGGGTSVVGHINPPEGGAPVLTLAMDHMRGLLSLDEVSRLATFQAGVRGPDLEAQLRAHSLTLGHFPQSFEYSTLGGWVATRSSGQQALGYGGIGQLFAGGRLETPSGTLELPSFPASAAGPDLRELVLGSEGRLGVLTRATVRVRPLPEREKFFGLFFPSWQDAFDAVREMAQAGVPISMVRLQDEAETRISLLLGGHRKQTALLERYLALRGAGKEKCLAVLACTGTVHSCRSSQQVALRVAHRHGGLWVGQPVGNTWRKTRFLSPYLRNTLWEAGYGVDTMETSLSWSRLPAALQAVRSGLERALEDEGERTLTMAHISRLYPDGACLYVTCIFRLADDPEQTMERWRFLKRAASIAFTQAGGTISHQHGVGVDHAPYLKAEKGALGLAALTGAIRALDPAGTMNPGKLLPGKE
jgi:alkyldihydroxyacetonephosphate synthase